MRKLGNPKNLIFPKFLGIFIMSLTNPRLPKSNQIKRLSSPELPRALLQQEVEKGLFPIFDCVLPVDAALLGEFFARPSAMGDVVPPHLVFARSNLKWSRSERAAIWFWFLSRCL